MSRPRAIAVALARHRDTRGDTVSNVLPSRFIVTLTLGASVGLAASVSHAQTTRSSGAPNAPTSASAAPSSAAPTASPASSASPGTPSTPEGGGVAVAQEHLQRALVHFRQHQYTEAIHEFELANAAAPSADFWFNIARCHELLSHYDEAIDFYQRYLRDKVDPPDRAQVQQHIAELRQSAEIARNAARRQNAQAAIRFELGNNVPTAALFIADRRVGQGSLTSPFPVTPGTYPVRVTADGMQDWRASVRVRQGETVTAFVGLQPATQYRTRSGGHIASYVLGAASILALGAGIALGAFAATQSPCTGDPVAMMADPIMCERRDWATRADILYGVGAGLVLTTAIVYFVEAGMSRTERVQRRTAFNR